MNPRPLVASALPVLTGFTVVAAGALRRPAAGEGHPWIAPLRRLHSGHVGDYAAWMLVGTTLFDVLAWPAPGTR
ncbi:hypothetical protein [Streptomyces sp. ML-6]|uniref:hypothetical protein n=1 Tax=Streptomyces sp. ML-6 TaxID=2982693 RepID=UPI0024C012EC|nr:hypothetical protein [Streptomyces sp. ML-6]MDK0523886.1 hypothetical protein [Streptomyces sp. ML-6]